MRRKDIRTSDPQEALIPPFLGFRFPGKPLQAQKATLLYSGVTPGSRNRSLSRLLGFRALRVWIRTHRKPAGESLEPASSLLEGEPSSILLSPKP